MKWFRLVQLQPDGSYLWNRGLDNSAYHYVGESAEVIALLLSLSSRQHAPYQPPPS